MGEGAIVGQERACPGILTPYSLFWAPPVAPGEVDPIGERVGAGEGHEPAPASHAELRPEHRSLRECGTPQPHAWFRPLKSPLGRGCLSWE